MSSSAMVVGCSICFGAADGPMLDAARLGVLVMVGVTCAVLVLFGRFFLRIARRGEGSRLQPGVPERGGMPRAGFASRTTETGN